MNLSLSLCSAFLSPEWCDHKMTTRGSRLILHRNPSGYYEFPSCPIKSPRTGPHWPELAYVLNIFSLTFNLCSHSVTRRLACVDASVVPFPMSSFGHFQWENWQGLEEKRQMKLGCLSSPDPFARVCMGQLCLLASSHRFCLNSFHTFPSLAPAIALQSCLYNIWMVPMTHYK